MKKTGLSLSITSSDDAVQNRKYNHHIDKKEEILQDDS